MSGSGPSGEVGKSIQRGTGDMNGVSSGLFEHLRGRSSLVDRQPVGFAVLLTGQTHDDGKRTTDLLLDRPE